MSVSDCWNPVNTVPTAMEYGPQIISGSVHPSMRTWHSSAGIQQHAHRIRAKIGYHQNGPAVAVQVPGSDGVRRKALGLVVLHGLEGAVPVAVKHADVASIAETRCRQVGIAVAIEVGD